VWRGHLVREKLRSSTKFAHRSPRILSSAPSSPPPLSIRLSSIPAKFTRKEKTRLGYLAKRKEAVYENLRDLNSNTSSRVSEVDYQSMRASLEGKRRDHGRDRAAGAGGRALVDQVSHVRE